MDDERIHELIGVIYDAAVDPRHWADVIVQLKTLTKSGHGHLWNGSIHDDVRDFLSDHDQYLAFESDGFSFLDFKTANDQLGDDRITDPHLDRQKEVPEGRAVLGREFVPLDDLRASGYYRDFARQFQLFHMLGSVMIRNGGAVSAVALYRSEREDLYSEKDKRLLDLFLPHIRRSLNLSRRLRQANAKAEALHGSIDTLSSVIVLVNRAGKVVFLNAAARRFIRRSGDLSVRRDRLYVKSHGDSMQLEKLIRNVTGAGGQRPVGGAVAFPRGNDALPLQVIAAPLPASGHAAAASQPDAVALLVVHDPDLPSPVPHEIMATLFGLTPMEGTLLLGLGEGQTLKQFGDEHRVSYNTARTHLRNVFAKTNTSKQSDLVRLTSWLTHSLTLSD